MVAERFGHTGKVGVIAKHDFLLDSEIKLRGGAIVAIDQPEGIGGFITHFFRLQEMVAPGLVAQVQNFFQSGSIANAANHGDSFLCLRSLNRLR